MCVEGGNPSLTLLLIAPSFIAAIQNMEYPDEETRTHLAIDTAVAMFDQYGRNGTVPRLMIVVTDGA